MASPPNIPLAPGQAQIAAGVKPDGTIAGLAIDDDSKLLLSPQESAVLPANAAKETDGNLAAILTALQPATTTPTNGVVTATGSAQQLPNIPGRLVTVVADEENETTIYVGGSNLTAANGIPLKAEYSRNYGVSNANLVYYMAASGSPVLRYEVQ